jgi:ubiquinone biosynthesis accessory factor UbiK
MIDTKFLDDAAKKLFDALPPSLQNLEQDIEQKFKEVLQTTFSRLDLVTREEFDVQVKVLARTREKIEALEQQLDKIVTQSKK